MGQRQTDETEMERREEKRGKNAQLALAAFEVHVPNLAEDGPLSPALVVNAADTPHAACVACRRVGEGRRGEGEERER